MIKDIKELNFPEYATLSHAECNIQDMAEKTITAQVSIDGQITPDFSYDWAVEFHGEKYILPLRQPQGAKGSALRESTIDLTFQHWAEYQLKRWYFFTVQPVETGTAVPDKYIAPVTLNLGDFCALFKQVLNYYYGDTITIDLNPAWQYSHEPVSVEISHSYVWDVLIKFYELFAVRWTIEPREDNSNQATGGERYVIKVGYPTNEISHIFSYGFDGGLLKVERQVQDENIRNMLIGRGGSKNLPLRYFKDADPANPTFPADPDWVPELKDMTFTELRGATFRSYIQGWKTRHYGGASVTSADKAYAPWAWKKGYSDTKFNPVEFVADEIVTEGQAGDRYVELLPGYTPAVKGGSSIDRYGPLFGGIENNDKIYPTIQRIVIDGVGRVDEVVDVEPVTSDDVGSAVKASATVWIEGAFSTDKEIDGNATVKMEVSGETFTVSDGRHANYDEGVKTIKLTKDRKSWRRVRIDGKWTFQKVSIPVDIDSYNLEIVDAYVEVIDTATGEARSASGIPPGTYYPRLSMTVHNTTTGHLNVFIECAEPTVTMADDTEKWASTWNIWIKNIFNTGRLSGESDEEYSERVWRRILGDRVGNNAKVVFSDGQLSVSEDYEFTIVSLPVPDESRSITIKNPDGTNTDVPSHWRITLGKSDADLEATGLYLPSTQRNARKGDHIVFIGMDMPHQYTVWAEERVDDSKKDKLKEIRDIKPTFVVELDKVRIHNYGREGALVDSILPGGKFRLADKRFIVNTQDTETAYQTFYIQSVTYTYNEPTDTEANILPDVAVVLSDKYEMAASPVATLQSDISALQQMVGSISNVEQIVRWVGDSLYLRKDGIPDRSMSPTEFASLLTSLGFRNGIVGGEGWGFFRDENGNWVLETDRINVRQDLQVNNLVINQVTARGGMIVESAAALELTRVVKTATAYICYFDRHNGSVANLFHYGDIAWCSRFDPENNAQKSYKRMVTEVGVDYVSLAVDRRVYQLPDGSFVWPVNGSGEPDKGDVIVQYGSYTDATRRFAKVRDVIDGGYERYIEGLDSATAAGTEYYFVGRQSGMYNGRPRFYIGDANGYIEWIDGELNVKAKINVLSTVGDKSLGAYVRDISAGQATCLLDLSNEMVAVPCDADGNPLSGLPATCTMNVYRGAGIDSGWEFAVKADGCGVSHSAGSNNFNVLGFNSNIDSATVTVTATKEGHDALTATMTIYKVLPGADGADGQNALVFSLEPDVDVVVRSFTGTPSVYSVTCGKYVTDGFNPRALTTQKILRAVTRKGDTSLPPVTIAGAGVSSGRVAVTEGMTAIDFILYDANGTTVLDRERVPVIADASDIDTGGGNQLVNSAFLNGANNWKFDGSTGIDAEMFLDGVHAIKISENGNTADVYHGFRQEYNVGTGANPQLLIPPGVRYVTYSVYTYKRAAIGFDNGANLEVYFKDAQGNRLSGTTRSYNCVPGAVGQWERKSRTEAVPAGAHSVVFLVYVTRNGELYAAKPQLQFGNVLSEWSQSAHDTDYLKQALQGSTSIDGGLVLSQMVQLGEMTESGHNVKAGMNGISGDTTGGGVALWAGGTLDDALNERSTFTLYMDGTIRAANGTVLINASQIRIKGKNSGNILLDNNGLTLLNQNGAAVCRVINEKLPSDAELLETIKKTLTWPQNSPVTIHYRHSGGYWGGPKWYPETLCILSPSTPATMPLGEVTAHSELRLNLKLAFNIPLSDPKAVVSGSVHLYLYKDGTRIYTAHRSFINGGSGGTHYVEFSLNETLEAGNYRIQVVPIAGTSGGGPLIEESHTSARPALTNSELTQGITSQNLLANDGFLSAWGRAVFCNRAGGMFMRAGNYGFRVSESGGLQKWDSGSNKWVAME